MKEVWEFLRAVFGSFAGLIGGAFLAGIQLVTGWLGWQTTRAGYAWEAFVALLVAVFLAWRTEARKAVAAAKRLNDFEEQAPLALMSVKVDGARVMLEIRNDGAQAEFSVTYDLALWAGLEHQPAVWLPRQPFGRRLIGKGQRFKVSLAKRQVEIFEIHNDEVDEEIRGWLWIFQYETGTASCGENATSFNESPDEDSYEMTVTAIAEPPMLHPYVRRLQFVGNVVIDLESGERHNTQPELGPTLAGYEARAETKRIEQMERDLVEKSKLK